MNGKIIILDISFDFGGTKDNIHPVVLLDNNETILIDCGYIGFLPNIETELLKNGISPESLTKVLITHHDHDHMGSLYDLKIKYPHIKIISSEVESNYISGKSKSLRLEQAEEMQKSLPEEQKAYGEQFISILNQVKSVTTDLVVNGGDVLDLCGGLEIIDTSGHTEGHISLFLPKHKTIIAGDAIILEDGKPVIALPQFAFDKEAAISALEKLLSLDAECIICYHGGVFTK